VYAHEYGVVACVYAHEYGVGAHLYALEYSVGVQTIAPISSTVRKGFEP
jgi:hypothetical protein